MTNKIKAPQLLALLETIVSETGADTKRDCYYRANPQPGEEAASPANCIAGEVVYRLGGIEALNSLREDAIITINDKIGGDRQNAKYDNQTNINQQVTKGLMTKKAARILRVAQYSQDECNTWGEAVADAKEYAAGRGSWND